MESSPGSYASQTLCGLSLAGLVAFANPAYAQELPSKPLPEVNSPAASTSTPPGSSSTPPGSSSTPPASTSAPPAPSAPIAPSPSAATGSEIPPPSAPVLAPPPAASSPYPYYPYPYPPPYAYPRKPDETKPTREWYGWQTLLIHGASVGVFFASFAGEGALAPVTVPIAISGVTLGGPIVHWTHGYLGKGFGSLGLYLGLPVLGSLIGILVCAACGPYALLIGPIFGGPVGNVVALIIDVAALSFTEGLSASEYDARLKPTKTPQFAILPKVDIGPHRAGFGVQGVF